MAKPKHYHHPIPAWKIDRQRLYAKLGALGGMADHANTKIRPDWIWQGKLMLDVGSKYGIREHSIQNVQQFEVRVTVAYGNTRCMPIGKPIPRAAHRIYVRCPRCHTWTPFGRLHQHILSQRCLATADVVNRLLKVPSVRVAQP